MTDDESIDEARSETRIALLRELAAADPGDATTWFLLGRELAAHGHAADACDAFAAAIRANPDYAAAYRQLGNAQEAAGRRDEAIATYRAGAAVAERTHDLQAGKEMNAFLRKLARGDS